LHFLFPSWEFEFFGLPTFAEKYLDMDVITIESQAYRELVTKINSIAKFVLNHQPEEKNTDDEWVDSYEVCTFLKISERTLQRLRSNGIISYSMLSGKSYYTIGEIKRMLNEKRIRSTEECLMDLIHNHKLHAEQRRNLKTDK
jgi:hypothetical protein